MTRDELIEKVARAIRRSHFQQLEKSHICDDTLLLSDRQLAEARAAADIVLEEAARIPETNSRVCIYSMADVLLAQAAAIRALKSGDGDE